MARRWTVLVAEKRAGQATRATDGSASPAARRAAEGEVMRLDRRGQRCGQYRGAPPAPGELSAAGLQ